MPTAIDEDRALVAAFLGAADERSFRQLYRRHTPGLYALARRLLGGSGSGAEDAVQETWIRAAERLGAFRWDSKLRTWLSGILVHCCREAIRARRSNPSSDDELEEPADAAAPRNEQQAAAIDLDRAIARLPDGYREVIVLHDVEGYTHEEIAEKLGIRDGTSKSQLFKARRQLRFLLEGARSVR